MRYEVGFLVKPEQSGFIAYLAHSSGALGPPYQYFAGKMYRQEYSFSSIKDFHKFLTKIEKEFGLDNNEVFKFLYLQDWDIMKGDK